MTDSTGWECGTSAIELDLRRFDCLKRLARDFTGTPNYPDIKAWEKGGEHAGPSHTAR